MIQSDKFKNNPVVKCAIDDIIFAMEEQQKTITTVKPPESLLIESYNDYLNRINKVRGGDLYYPYIGSGFGNGALVELADGSVKYDFICGIGPHFWGHNHPKIVRASLNSALGDTVMQGHLQQNKNSLELMESIIKLANPAKSGLTNCFLTTSGAMANENALKIAFQKKPNGQRILCFEKCFSGRTMSLAQMTDKPAFRQGLPTCLDVDYVPFFDENNPIESTKRAVAVLEKHISRFPHQHAAMCMELVQGEAGYYAGNTSFFKALMEVLNEHNIAIWVDEIQTFGRLGKPFAFQYFKLDKYVNIVTIGKMSQVCATLFTNKYKPTPGLLSQTFSASNSMIETSKVIIDELQSGHVTAKTQKLSEHFVSHLKSNDNIKGPYGIGGMIAMTVFDGDSTKTVQFVKRLYDNGVISFMAGNNPMRVRFLPPFAAVSMEDIDNVYEIIKKTIDEMK